MDIKDIIAEIKNDKMFGKYIMKDTWISGSSTIVHPISVSEVSKQIIFQLNTDRKIFDKFIRRTCEKYDNLKNGVFVKSDGSCPSTISFYYN